MSAPESTEYSTEYVIAANGALKTLIESEGTAGCSIKLYDAADVLLATLGLSDPPAAVDAVTGELTLSVAGIATATGAGKAAYGSACKADGAWVVRIPCERGQAPATGKIVLNQLTVIVGAKISISSASII